MKIENAELKGPWADMPNGIMTQSGNKVDLLNPSSDQLTIEDIARGLAYKAHYCGHTPFYFSIAEHSILVSKITNGLLPALLHDASEAYLSDIVRPLKTELPEYREIEKNFMKVIYESFGISLTDKVSDSIKFADVLALSFEWRNFFPGEPDPFIDNSDIEWKTYIFNLEIHYYSPDIAMKMFLREFNKIIVQK